ncbi:uncharacterized protein STEHIDRAFT_148199 [Stereum hirsutum FP-91666 SS1]|uniref:uncharacterized protein n=1 Tax=Stereum hirsutum (strain FP-91666) TaxID=721885 RepID=UPI000444A49E|nr:uncharacterized protein STEHIDRAFT_148199 [Stereum hirsutum FP-91666 SS1]EIM84934.1 hypothetical protein STEHIDRAFT_148199 [Stereum hirsutum FP-91666 SS1]
MASSARPIRLPVDQDATMASSSYTNNGSFNANPASYTRPFFGSPISWRAGSFGSRFYHPGNSPGQLLGPLDPTDFRAGKLSSSLESDRGSLINALSAMEREEEFCRNYTCCGLNLTDLHALVDHFEECHVVVVDPYTQQAAYVSPAPGTTVKPNNYMTAEQQLSLQQQQHLRLQLDMQQQQQQQQMQQQQHQHHQQQSLPQSNLSSHPQQQSQVGAFDPDDMELDLDSSPSSSASSPPQTPLSTTITPYPSNSAYPPAGLSNLQTNLPLSQPHPNYSHLNFNSLSLNSPHSQPTSSCPSPVSAFDTTTVLPSRSSPLGNFPPSMAQRSNAPADAFNAYSTYAEYNNTPNSAGMSAAGMMQQQASMSTDEWSASGANGQGVASEPSTPYGCVPPALLFSNHTTPAGTPAGSRDGSPKSASATATPATYQPQASSSSSAASSSTAKASKKSGKSSPAPRASGSSSSSANASAAAAASIASRPGASLLLSKPFRCPKPNCNKSYKQANGLKYHMTHGSCNFAPPKDLEALQALLAERAERQALANGGAGANGAGGAGGRLEVKVGAGGVVEGVNGLGMGMNMTEGEMREVEREAERRLRPFACGVGECQRRYKNMNGLRYHYQHSGDHGAIGLALLASGQHECLQNSKAHASSMHRSSSHSRTNSASASTSTSRTGTPHSTAPSTPTTGAAPPAWAQMQQQVVAQQHQQQQQAAQQQLAQSQVQQVQQGQQQPQSYTAYQHSFPAQQVAATAQPAQPQQAAQQYSPQAQQAYAQQYGQGVQAQGVPVGGSGGQGYAQAVQVQQGYGQQQQ